MAFETEIAYASGAGEAHANEDFCAALLPEPGCEGFGAICAIADGVSRGGKGREAAQSTVMSVVQDYYATNELWETSVALDRVIGAQNSWLASINRQRAAQKEYGLCTLTALVLRGQTYTLAHVGDTRAYLLRDGVLSQLSHDHVVDHPDFRHQLLRSVGADDRISVDFTQGELAVADCFILLSDGVHGSVKPKQILKLCAQGSAQEICDSLLFAARENGATDDASALVVRVKGLQDLQQSDQRQRARSLPIPARLKLGDLIDGLRVTSLIADSGVNLIYQVRAPQSRALYVLKTLHPGRAHDAEERAMLAHEAWLALRMQTGRAGQHLAFLHAQLPDKQSPSAFYLLYDWHSGESLERRLKARGAFGALEAAQICIQALNALAALHRQGVIHRDIKPANLHLSDAGVLRLLDLGVALSGQEPPALRTLHAGTPSYMNPEQFGYGSGGEREAKSANAASDLYALGVTLYELLTARLPYGQVLPYQTGRFYGDPKPPSRINAQVPVWLDHIALKAVARDEKQRFETAEEFLLALERGASRPLGAPLATPLIARNRSFGLKLSLALSALFNVLLLYWLLFVPR